LELLEEIRLLELGFKLEAAEEQRLPQLHPVVLGLLQVLEPCFKEQMGAQEALALE
jgi:hypothetical protein